MLQALKPIRQLKVAALSKRKPGTQAPTREDGAEKMTPVDVHVTDVVWQDTSGARPAGGKASGFDRCLMMSLDFNKKAYSVRTKNESERQPQHLHFFSRAAKNFG